MEKELPIYELKIDEAIDGSAEVDFVALVDKPAVQRNFLKFAEDKKMRFQIDDEEQRIISGVLMLADTPIYRNDGVQEYYVVFSAETIAEIAQKFFRKGYQNNVNLMHDSGQQLEGITMFESWIKDSKRGVRAMKGFDDVPDGSWFGSYKVYDDATWEKIKSGEVLGFSVEGDFIYKQKVSKEEQMMKDIIAILQSV
jgi:hypothetical protein